jgi:FlaA1/EpsC-like NDP-sugar epimerase
MIGHCKDTLFRLDSSLEYRGWSREILTIYENFFREGVLIHDYRLFDNWDTLLSADKVYVYGAGKACKELLKKTSHRMDYSGIIVTEKCETREELYDLPIYEVGDSQIDKEALILICITGKKIQDEVKRTLCFNGFQNMLCVAREWLE